MIFDKIVHRCFVLEKMPRYSTNFSSSTAAVAATARTTLTSAAAAAKTAAVAATYSSSIIAAVHIHVDRSSVVFGGAPPWAVSAPDHHVGAWAWVQTRVIRPALSLRAGGRRSRQERNSLWAWLTQCVLSSLAG